MEREEGSHCREFGDDIQLIQVRYSHEESLIALKKNGKSRR